MGESIRRGLLVVALSMVVPEGARAAEVGTAVGQAHAQIVLPNIVDRRPTSLSEFRGKKVLLIQFAAW